MKQQSIPRLELQAAMYEARLKQLIVDEHDVEIEPTFFVRIRQLFCEGCTELSRNNQCL